MAQGEIRSLTGLRGVAAVVVVAYHYRTLAPTDLNARFSFRPGYLMVDLFFILSGFVMALTYGEAFRRGFSWAAYLRFLEKRFARIYPLYAVVVITVLATIPLWYPPHPKHPLLLAAINIPLLQSLGGGMLCFTCSAPVIAPAWSISTEVGAYLLFPALVAVALFRAQWLTMACFGAAVTTVIAVSVAPISWTHQTVLLGPLDVSNLGSLWPFVRCVAEFYIGLVIWRASSSLPQFIEAGWLSYAIVAAIGLLWLSPGSDVLIVTMFAILILHLCHDRTPLARLLSGRLPHLAGEWSYAIYLIHWPMLALLTALLPVFKSSGMPHAWSFTLLTVASFSVALAGLAHYWIEKPARKWVMLAFDRLRQSPLDWAKRRTA